MWLEKKLYGKTRCVFNMRWLAREEIVLQYSLVAGLRVSLYCNKEGRLVGKRQCVTIQFLYRDSGSWVRLRNCIAVQKLYCDLRTRQLGTLGVAGALAGGAGRATGALVRGTGAQQARGAARRGRAGTRGAQRTRRRASGMARGAHVVGVRQALLAGAL